MIAPPDTLPGLLPRLVGLIFKLREAAKAEGIETIVPAHGGVRTVAEQWQLFALGRLYKNGRWAPVDALHRKGIVTNAMPASAPHCPHVDHDGSIGSAACDVAVLVAGKIAWEPGDSGYDDYPLLGRVGENLGLSWGGRWPGRLVDLDHFELPDWRSMPLAPDALVPQDESAQPPK